MRRLWISLSIATLLSACHKAETPVQTATAAPATATTAAPASVTPTLPAHNGENLVALASGAMPVILASAPGQGGEAYYMFDEDSSTG